jgi:hypothetical protein
MDHLECRIAFPDPSMISCVTLTLLSSHNRVPNRLGSLILDAPFT